MHITFRYQEYLGKMRAKGREHFIGVDMHEETDASKICKELGIDSIAECLHGFTELKVIEDQRREGPFEHGKTYAVQWSGGMEDEKEFLKRFKQLHSKYLSFERVE